MLPLLLSFPLACFWEYPGFLQTPVLPLPNGIQFKDKGGTWSVSCGRGLRGEAWWDVQFWGCVCGEIDTFSFIYCNNAPPYYIFFPFKTLKSFHAKLPLWYSCFVVLCTTWWHLPTVYPRAMSCHRNTAEDGHLHPHPSFLLQFSSLPPDLRGPVIPICPSAQSLGIKLQVFLQANKLTLQFRHLGSPDRTAVLLLKTVSTIFHHHQQ